MFSYYVNKNRQANGNHEVHVSGCSYFPAPQNAKFLGTFSSCKAAVRKAKEYYDDVNGCYYCSKACHTE
ncbi:MAG: hypothetical protein R3346_04395 [Candidatus Spechtbacterales bacterium]|nr:hypothetical protein [Candidatus Spechtbacterales bacterium]